MSADRNPTSGCDRGDARAGHGPVADAQCVLLHALRADLVGCAAGLDRPAGAQDTLDLFHHMNSIYEEGTAAARATRVVLELGWRPSVKGGA